jgi:DNA-binding NarL/FixJ family response regulator
MSGNTKRPRVLLADDHAVVIDGLRRLLEPEFEVVGTAGDGWELLAAAERLKPELIVADISMPLLNGIEALRHLKKAGLRAKVIILSMHADVEFGVEALRSGASGYVLKHSASEALSRAIREVLEGRIYVSPRIAVDVLSGFTGTSQEPSKAALKLTQREREVLQLVAEGCTISGIGNILKIAARTVVFHKSNIMDKLGVRTTADLTRSAIRHGLVPAPNNDGTAWVHPAHTVNPNNLSRTAKA